MENRIAIFSKLVRDFMRDVPLAVPMGTSLADIARRMEAEQAPSATVTDGQGRPTGIVTERGITRRAAFGLDGDTAAAEEYLYYAILRHRPHAPAGSSPHARRR